MEVDARGEVVKLDNGADLGVAGTHPSIVFRRIKGGRSESAKYTCRGIAFSCGREDSIGWRLTGAETRRIGVGGSGGMRLGREGDR